MNTTTFRIVLAAGLLAAALVPAAGAAAAGVSSLTIDCAAPALPTQAQVGDMLDLHNQGQVYAARARLMGDAVRACRKQGARMVVVVVEPARDANGQLQARGLASARAGTP